MCIKKRLLAVSLAAALPFAASAVAQEEKPKPQVLFTNVNVFDGNPLEDISVLGANSEWFDASIARIRFM